MRSQTLMVRSAATPRVSNHEAPTIAPPRKFSMSASNALHIAVLGGDGIGPEVMAPALEVLRTIEATSDLKFRFTEAPAGANHYRETGKSMPESTIRLCEEADAILLGACGLLFFRDTATTEIAPQIE